MSVSACYSKSRGTYILIKASDWLMNLIPTNDTITDLIHSVMSDYIYMIWYTCTCNEKMIREPFKSEIDGIYIDKNDLRHIFSINHWLLQCIKVLRDRHILEI